MSALIDRRNFVKGTALAGGIAAAAGAGISTAAYADEASSAIEYPEGLSAEDYACSVVELEPITDFIDEKTFDVVVVGAGTSGLPAVLTALEEGATVGCLQKESVPISQGGGSSGIIHEMSTPLGEREWFSEYNKDCSYRINPDLVNFFINYSGETCMWMTKQAEAVGFPPYVHTTRMFSHTYSENSYVLIPWNNYGPKPKSNLELIQLLAERAAELGAEFFFETPGVQLIQDESGRVVGVVGKTADGYIKFNATKGVILATGDYQNNDSMVAKFSPDLVRFSKKQFGKTGDGILMSMAIGGKLCPVMHSKQMHDFDAGPMQDEPFLALDEKGHRFMNEETPMISWNLTLRWQDAPDPGKFVRIWDANYAEQVSGWGGRPSSEEQILNFIPGALEEPKGVTPGLIDTHKADTLEELAEQLGIPADALIASVERYNELCEKGVDEDFAKNPMYLKPITTPPFYGVHQWMRVTAICGGVQVNGNYQVIDGNGDPIEGLWAVGFGAGDLCGDVDWSFYLGGLSNGSCMTSGRYAAIQAVTGGFEPSHPAVWDDVKELYQ